LNYKKIKNYRKRKGYTLAELSSRTGYTSSFLSQIENGIKQPSLKALRKITSTLDVPIFELFSDDNSPNDLQDDAQERSGKSHVIIRKDKRKQAVMPEIFTEYDFITPYSSDRTDNAKLIGMYTVIKPGCWASEEQVSLDYDISAYIISGKAKGCLDDEVIDLEEGDSIYMYAHAPHNFLNVGDDELIMLGYASKDDVLKLTHS
jgi:transcriptional regulator with XRE-family HTH domain